MEQMIGVHLVVVALLVDMEILNVRQKFQIIQNI